MTVLSLGFVRGLAAQILGTALGMALVVVVRVLVGLPAWKAEPAVVVGAMVGTISFLIGVGSLNDWIKWAKGQETPMVHPPAGRPGPAILAWTTTTG